MPLKNILTYLFVILLSLSSYAQSPKIELNYTVHGMGSSRGEVIYPTVDIFNNSLQYTFRQKSGAYKIETYEKFDWIDTIWEFDTLTKPVIFKTTSIDSIIAILRPISDSSIYKVNLGIRSGALFILTVKTLNKEIEITMSNTFDSTAYQIVQILNSYLPKEHKIRVPHKMWETEGEYLNFIRRNAKLEEEEKLEIRK